MKIERFEDIQAWQAARELSKLVYQLTGKEGLGRDFGLCDQIRTAAVSVMANIAEGFDAGSDAEFRRFLSYAKRSATEVQSHAYAALDSGYIVQGEFDQLYSKANEAKHLIGGFVRYLKSGSRSQSAANKSGDI